MLDDGGTLATDVDRDRIEEGILIRRKVQASQASRQRSGATMHVVSNAAQPFRAMVDGVHRSHHRQQHLRGTDVGGRFVTADVLLARLQG